MDLALPGRRYMIGREAPGSDRAERPFFAPLNGQARLTPHRGRTLPGTDRPGSSPSPATDCFTNP